MDFRSFKECLPVRQMSDAMNIGELLRAAQSWDHLRRAVVRQNDERDGQYVEAARRHAGECSSGERVLLHALLYATDFAWLADELDDGRTWRRFGNASGDHREAVIACMQLE